MLDAVSGKHIRTLLGYLSPPEIIRFSSDGKTLITLDERGTLQFWQIASGSELLTWPSGHPIRRFDLTDDDREFAIIHGETVELFDASRSADMQSAPVGK